MIVRIMGEGQYRLTDEVRDRVNELDNAVVDCVDAGDESSFQDRFDELLHLVRTGGEHLGDDELESSDVIIPPADTTFEEAAGEFTGEGLIPD